MGQMVGEKLPVRGWNDGIVLARKDKHGDRDVGQKCPQAWKVARVGPDIFRRFREPPQRTKACNPREPLLALLLPQTE
jgi:hypothetical protein